MIPLKTLKCRGSAIVISHLASGYSRRKAIWVMDFEHSEFDLLAYDTMRPWDGPSWVVQTGATRCFVATGAVWMNKPNTSACSGGLRDRLPQARTTPRFRTHAGSGVAPLARAYDWT